MRARTTKNRAMTVQPGLTRASLDRCNVGPARCQTGLDGDDIGADRANLQRHYDIPGLSTIRQAQSPLVDEGLLERRAGVGVFVISTTPRAASRADVLAELRQACNAIDRAIALVEQSDLS